MQDWRQNQHSTSHINSNSIHQPFRTKKTFFSVCLSVIITQSVRGNQRQTLRVCVCVHAWVFFCAYFHLDLARFPGSFIVYNISVCVCERPAAHCQTLFCFRFSIVLHTLCPMVTTETPTLRSPSRTMHICKRSRDHFTWPTVHTNVFILSHTCPCALVKC